MQARPVDLPQFVNVAAGARAIIDRVPMGPVYEGIFLKLGGTTFTKALIDKIEVILAGKHVVNITGSHLDDINDYMKRTANAAYLSIWFADPNARTVYGSRMGALDTSVGYSDFQLKVSINASAVAPTLSARALISDPFDVADPDRLKIRALLQAEQAPAAAGTPDLQPNLGSASGALLRMLHIFHANLTHLEVKKDGLPLMDKFALADMQFLQNELNRTTQANHFAYDPLAFYDNQSDAVPTLKRLAGGSVVPANFQFKGTVSGADTLTMYSDVYTTIAAL